MEVAFNVAWGPISQIAVPLLDLKSAVELAVGAHGWWKARQRSVSLLEMVLSGGGALVPSFAFNLRRYVAACQTAEFRGIAWFDGRLESLRLPNASTAIKGDAGLLCLRALTTVLLALYDVESTCVVLSHIIPNCLVNYDLEDDCIRVDGPFISSVRNFTSAVNAEEQCSTLRKNLHGSLNEEYNKLFSAPACDFSSSR